MLNRAIACFTLVACVYASASWAQSPVRYVYDDLGRLVGVIDQNGDAATYNYDAVGNLLSITRTASTAVSVIAFAPRSGAIGTTVKISGTGFSSTPGANAVTFNGTAATVSTASANELVVTVPSGATTGTIAVTSPAGSATSATSFTVMTANLAPTITSFSPTAGLAGSSVTISGTNFDTVLANDRTRVNAALTSVSSGSTSSLTALIPTGTGSGHIGVATPYGSAVSTDDFIIPPSGFAVADVQVSGRIPFATGTTVTTSTANKIGLMLFDSSPGHRLALRGTNGLYGFTFGCDLLVSILNPNATVIAGPTCMEQSGFIDATSATTTGTYTILVDPADSAFGSVTLTLYDVPSDVTGTITPGGSGVTVTTTTPGQNGALTFSGTAGHRISLLGINGITGQVLGCDVNVTILKPDKSVLAPATCMEGFGYVEALTLPSTGTYTITIDPADVATGSVTLGLYDVPADVSGSITAGGSPVTITTTVPSQNAALTFSGTAGDRISLLGTNGMTGQVGFLCDVGVSIKKPDGTELVPSTCMEGSGFIDLTVLPSTGTYTIFIDPNSYATGSLTLTLYSVPADASGTLTVGGSSINLTTSTPGQNAIATFSGTASQQVTVHLTNNWNWVTLKLLKPDGTVLVSTTSLFDFNLATQTLPTTGTYTIVVDISGAGTGTVTLSVTNP